MTGKELKEILRRDGVNLLRLSEALGFDSDARLHSALKADDVKTGLLEKIANATNKSVSYYISHGVESTGAPVSPHGLPLIPISVVAGFSGTDNGGITLNDCTLYDVPEFAQAKADFLIRVSGSSMYPKYSSGDVLACRKIDEITFIQWGKVYVIDSRQGQMVKRLMPAEGDDDSLMCVSDNDKYPPFKLPKTEIRSLSIVVGAIRLE